MDDRPWLKDEETYDSVEAKGVKKAGAWAWAKTKAAMEAVAGATGATGATGTAEALETYELKQRNAAIKVEVAAAKATLGAARNTAARARAEKGGGGGGGGGGGAAGSPRWGDAKQS